MADRCRKTLRRIWRAAAVLALAIPLSAPARSAEPYVTVMSWGGAYQEAQRKAFFQPYSYKSGIRVIEREYSGDIDKIRAMVEAKRVTVDVVDVTASMLRQGCREGLFEAIDWSEIGDQSEWLDGTASPCGVGTIVYATVLAFDGSVLRDAPTTIDALFDLAKYPGKRGLWKNPITNLEFALLADGVPASKIYQTLSTLAGVDRAFAKLDTIKRHIVWWESGAEAPQLLADGTVVMTTAWNGRIHDANKEGRYYRIVWDGQLLEPDFWAIPRGSTKKKMALEFIKFTVAPWSLARLPQYIPYGPVRITAMKQVNPIISRYLPTEPDNMTNALTINHGFWGQHAEVLRSRFNAWLAR